VRLRLSCSNAATGEEGSVTLAPETVARVRDGFRVRLSMKQAWPQLPYPIDRTGIDSKPMAIIEQQTHRSPFGLSEAALRRRFAAVTSYMLETAGHRYPLPLGDGRLDCRVNAGAGGTLGRSPSFAVTFGRGLPDGTYPRDRSLPAVESWPLWGLDGPLRSVPAPDASRTARDLAELEGLDRSRTARRLQAIRRADNGSAVAPWIEATLDEIATHPEVDPPHAARALALVSVAAYDATVLAARAARTYGRPAPCHLDPRLAPVAGCAALASYPSEHGAVAAAASRVLAALFPDASAHFAALALFQGNAVLQAGWALRGDLDAGAALGRLVGDRLVTHAQSDGADTAWTGTVPVGPGLWQPTPPAFGPPTDPLVGSWSTWNLTSGSEFRPPPPPAPGTPRFEAEVHAVYDLSRPLSIEHQEIASSWEDKLGSFTPAGHWNAIALRLVRARGLSTPEAALVFATMNTAQADAFIACWDAKYTYWSERPVTAIRETLDPGWAPYIYTPSFPSYPSGHSTTSAAAATVLAHFFPKRSTQLEAMAAQAGASRIYGGIHFPSDNEAGRALGRKVGEAALAQVTTIRIAQ
jgi:membrane-associated phospholipid phosphatase